VNIAWSIGFADVILLAAQMRLLGCNADYSGTLVRKLDRTEIPMNRLILSSAIALALAAASGVALAQTVTPGDKPKGTVAPPNQTADHTSAKEKFQKAGISA
jgi:hypothetical protein